MSSLARLTLLLAVAAIIGGVAFLVARRRAGGSAGKRRFILASNLLAIVLGLVLALWLPSRVPETSGSPASLVAVVVLWIVGGGLAFLGVAAFLGACFARRPPVASGDGKPTPR